MVRISTTKTVRRRKNVDIESAPESSSSSLQSDNTKEAESSPPSLVGGKKRSVIAQCPCTTLLLAFCIVYVTIGVWLPDPVQRKAYWRPVTSLLSATLSLWGFTFNVVKDVQIDGRTEKWRKAIDTLVLFLRESGLDYEWSETLQSTFLFADLVVLTDIQKEPQSQRRSSLVLPLSTDEQEDLNADLLLGQHYMRYATSVYGREMIASAELQVYGVCHICSNPSDSDAQVIARHVHLPAQEGHQVWFSDLTPGENPNHESLRTIVVCNHVEKVVVVSIRGTFSLSGIIVDLAGFCEPFCGGWAHAGFAAAARNTWDTVWETVLKEKIKELPNDYDLVFTGHSMGAGVACLITILLHYDTPPALRNRRIRCYAMAPPPVFTPLSAAPEAVSNITAYVHNWDCVPSISVDAIRRFMDAVSRIDAVVREHPMWQLAAERYELGEPAQDLVQAYEQQVALRPLEQAPTLFVPAHSLIWLERKVPLGKGDNSAYQAHRLDPLLYADRILDVKIPDMMLDHIIPEYEAAFEQVILSPPASWDQIDPPQLRGGWN